MTAGAWVALKERPQSNTAFVSRNGRDWAECGHPQQAGQSQGKGPMREQHWVYELGRSSSLDQCAKC